jgi:hypothetical protein
LGIEVGVPQEAADERSDFILPDVCHNYAVAEVPQARFKKVAVPPEKGGVALSSEQNDNFLVFRPFRPKSRPICFAFRRHA